MSSLENAIAILGLLTRQRPQLRVGEVCRDLVMPKSSVSRLLRTMAEAGLLERSGEGAGYSVGPRALELGNLYVGRFALIELVDRAIDELVGEFGFTGYAAALSGAEIVLLRVKQGAHPLRYVRQIGARLPADRTAMGLALLSRLSAQELEEWLGNISAAARRRAAVSAVKSAPKTGLVTTASVLTPGFTTIAAALVDSHSADALAFALAYPDAAVDRRSRGAMEQRVLEKTETIARQVNDGFWALGVKL
jgi:DNA-binding IclR family transcriptional regulator